MFSGDIAVSREIIAWPCRIASRASPFAALFFECKGREIAPPARLVGGHSEAAGQVGQHQVHGVESVELHAGGEAQAQQEQTQMARRFVPRRVPKTVGGCTFQVPAPEERVIVQPMTLLSAELLVGWTEVGASPSFEVTPGSFDQ